MDEDEAVERTRAADPGAGAEPDGERLAALTGERRADELAARRSRPRWAAVAAVAAGALLVGGGAGFGIGRTSETPPGDQTAVASWAPATEPEVATGGAADEPAQSMSAAESSVPGYGGQRTTFTAEGLSDAGGSAPAWAYDGASVFTEESALRVAEVLGVEGEPRLEAGWAVGSADGSGPTLSIGPDAAVSVFFTDPALHELLEDVAPVEPLDDGAAEDGGGVAAVEPQPATEPTAVAPGGAAPEGPAGVLYETLAALGVDPESAEYTEQELWAGGRVASVVAHQLAGGTRTGYSWSAEVVDGEVMSFHGPLAPLVELGEYDVVSPAEAVERLGDPRFGGSPVWLDDVVTLPVPEPGGRSWDDPPPPAPAPGAAVPWPVTEVTIVSAEPALTTHDAGGGTLLLPAYELSDAQGQTWSVVAVADHELAF
ncbi:hypothetical protein AA0Y32_13160 [Georgenia phoenicis]|uniref:hypothetical protein n=1 Tax=unclassified Georgenia TaxID=2626815 RepID=UPI0039B011C1